LSLEPTLLRICYKRRCCLKNIQRTWDKRQELNQVSEKVDFMTAISGALDWRYFFSQAKLQYLENKKQNIDVVVFGHTHVPIYKTLENGKIYINDGTWIDHNTD
jgi:UDP-2,3-diacylglucosamine pyrophosphatase LpxH